MTENDERCSMKDVECINLEYPTDTITLNELAKKPLEKNWKRKILYLYAIRSELPDISK